MIAFEQDSLADVLIGAGDSAKSGLPLVRSQRRSVARVRIGDHEVGWTGSISGNDVVRDRSVPGGKPDQVAWPSGRLPLSPVEREWRLPSNKALFDGLGPAQNRCFGVAAKSRRPKQLVLLELRLSRSRQINSGVRPHSSQSFNTRPHYIASAGPHSSRPACRRYRLTMTSSRIKSETHPVISGGASATPILTCDVPRMVRFFKPHRHAEPDHCAVDAGQVHPPSSRILAVLRLDDDPIRSAVRRRRHGGDE